MKKKKYYKLIKEYPGSPKLGTIAHEDKYNPNKYYTALGEFAMLTQNTLDKFSEFWEKVVEKDKDYEILSILLRKPEKHIIRKIDLDDSESYIESLIKCDGNKIYSVKRLSDDEVFTIGDEVHLTNGNYYGFRLKEFKFFHNGENGHLEKHRNKTFLKFGIISDLHKEPKFFYLEDVKKTIKQPLFTTKDGVDIYEGDKYWLIVNSDMAMPNTARKEWSYNSENKRFSTKKAAENYIKPHKPCLSYQEILSIFDETCSNSNIRNDFKTKLTKLINTKI